MPSTAEESIPELLARLEREHVARSKFCVGCWDAGADNYLLPCDIARLVAHIRSLERTLPYLWFAASSWDEYATPKEAMAWLLDIQQDEPWTGGKHQGDCTKEAFTCSTCLFESQVREANEALVEARAALGEAQ
jgi:hypothetical protein